MKNYGLSNDKRKTVLLIIFVVSLIAGTYLYPLVNKFLAYVCETVPSLKAFLKDWEYLGLFSTQITVFVIFNFLIVHFGVLSFKISQTAAEHFDMLPIRQTRKSQRREHR